MLLRPNNTTLLVAPLYRLWRQVWLHSGFAPDGQAGTAAPGPTTAHSTILEGQAGDSRASLLSCRASPKPCFPWGFTSVQMSGRASISQLTHSFHKCLLRTQEPQVQTNATAIESCKERRRPGTGGMVDNALTCRPQARRWGCHRSPCCLGGARMCSCFYTIK